MSSASERDGRIENTGVSLCRTKAFSREHTGNIIKTSWTSHNNSTEWWNKNVTEFRAFNSFQKRGSSAQNSPRQKDLVQTKLYVRLTNVICNKTENVVFNKTSSSSLCIWRIHYRKHLVDLTVTLTDFKDFLGSWYLRTQVCKKKKKSCLVLF